MATTRARPSKIRNTGFSRSEIGIPVYRESLGSALFARDRTIADIMPMEHAVPGYLPSQSVGGRLSFGHAVTKRGRTQYAATGGDDLFVFQCRTGMEDLAIMLLLIRQP